MQISYTGINATRWFASLLAPSETGLAKRSRQVPNEVAARLHGTHWKIQTSNCPSNFPPFFPTQLACETYNLQLLQSAASQSSWSSWSSHGPMASAGPPDRRSRPVARWAVDLIAIQAIHSLSWCSSCHVCHVCHVSWLPSSTKLGETWENLMRTSYVFLSCGNSMKISGGFWWPIHEEHHPLNEATWRAWVYWSCALHLGIWGHCAICCQPKMSIVEAWFVAIFRSDTKSFDFEVTPNSFQSWHLDISIHFLSKNVQKHDVHSVDPGASRAYASIAADLPMENVCIHLSVFADVLWSSKWKFIHQGAKVCQKSQRSGEFQGRMDNLAHRGCTIGIKIQVAHTLLKKITGRLHWSKIPNIPKAESTITAFLANIDNIFAVPWIIDCICISNFPGNVTIPRQNDLQLTNPLSSHWATDSANTWPHVGR